MCPMCAPITSRANWGQHVLSAWRESIHCSHNVAYKCFQIRCFAQLSPFDIWTEWLPQLWGDGNSAGPFKIMCHIPEENKLRSLRPLKKTCDLWPMNRQQLPRDFLLTDFGLPDILSRWNRTKRAGGLKIVRQPDYGANSNQNAYFRIIWDSEEMYDAVMEHYWIKIAFKHCCSSSWHRSRSPLFH